MGNNEVIIDGCNVAECEFFGKYNVCKAYVYMPKSCGCDYNPNCYFKQLQRIKSENEELKRLINMHLTTFDKCCVNGLIINNNMSEVLNEQNDVGLKERKNNV